MINAMLDAYDDSVQSEQVAAGSAPRQSFLSDGDEFDEDGTTTLPQSRFQDGSPNQDSMSSSSMASHSSLSGITSSKMDEIRLLRAEDAAHKLANTNTVSAERMKAFMEATSEPFAKPLPPDSRWAEKETCCIAS